MCVLFVLWVTICLFKFPDWLNDLSHSEQVRILSPLWVSICIANLLRELINFEHCVQLCLFAILSWKIWNLGPAEKGREFSTLDDNVSALFLSANYPFGHFFAFKECSSLSKVHFALLVRMIDQLNDWIWKNCRHCDGGSRRSGAMHPDWFRDIYARYFDPTCGAYFCNQTEADILGYQMYWIILH